MFFSKIFKSGPKVSNSDLEWSKSIFQVFLTVTHLLDHFWTAWAKGHVSLLPGLALFVVLAVHSALACQKILKGLDP